jgi:hypothetical protein
VIPALLVVSLGRVVVDANLVIDVAVEVGVDVGLEDVLEDAELGDFLRPEALRIVEDLAVTIPQNVGGEPSVDAQRSWSS